MTKACGRCGTGWPARRGSLWSRWSRWLRRPRWPLGVAAPALGPQRAHPDPADAERRANRAWSRRSPTRRGVAWRGVGMPRAVVAWRVACVGVARCGVACMACGRRRVGPTQCGSLSPSVGSSCVASRSCPCGVSRACSSRAWSNVCVSAAVGVGAGVAREKRGKARDYTVTCQPSRESHVCMCPCMRVQCGVCARSVVRAPWRVRGPGVRGFVTIEDRGRAFSFRQMLRSLRVQTLSQPLGDAHAHTRLAEHSLATQAGALRARTYEAAHTRRTGLAALE